MKAIKDMVDIREEIRVLVERINDMEQELNIVMERLTIEPRVTSQVTMQCRVYRAGGRRLGEMLDHILVKEMLRIAGMDEQEGKGEEEDNVCVGEKNGKD